MAKRNKRKSSPNKTKDRKSVEQNSTPNVTSKKKLKVVNDNPDGTLNYKIGQTLNDEFKILETLGAGTFGQVVKAKEVKTNQDIAIKITNGQVSYRRNAQREISTLEKLANKKAADQ